MDIEGMKRELLAKDRSGALQAAARSDSAARLAERFDGAAVEAAARQGDGETLSRLLGEILATEEGRRFADQVRKAVEDRGR